MANYIGANCPVCDKPFTVDDDIVVCPICGTPHHRICYQELERCACDSLHAQGHVWEPPKTEDEPLPAQDGGQPPFGAGTLGDRVCPSCGADNPLDSIFCLKCGARLDQQGTPTYNAASSAYTAAFGGVSPNEKIAGVTARDLALYVGTGSHYFLPRFQAIDEGAPVSVNVPALLNFLYLFYRKMYTAGAILLGFYAVMQIPSVFYTFEMVGYFVQHINEVLPHMDMSVLTAFVPQRFTWTLVAMPIARYLMLAVSIMLSLFGNRIYLASAVSNIRRIRLLCEQAPGGFDDGLYTEMLARRGRTSFGIVVAVIIGLIFVSFFISFVFMLPHMESIYAAMGQ